jgi:hypothetical protein
MKVKIGDKIYDAEVEPIIITISNEDRRNINNMDPNATLYCVYPEDMDTKEVMNLLKTAKEELK